MLISKTGDSEEESSALDSQACPHCGAAREFVLEQTPSPASYIISVCALFYFGIWSIFIIPLVVQSTKMIIKRCYYCSQEIEKRKFFQLPDINDKILQFRFGGCMIVLSRKYALFLLLVVVALFFYVEMGKEDVQPAVAQLESEKSWLDFLQLCGKFQFVENGLKARHNFEEHFKDRLVRWKGDFTSIKGNPEKASYPFDYWVFIKMEPTESTENFPDLTLGVMDSFPALQRLKHLQVGQPISFDARFLALGSDYSFHVLELLNMAEAQEPQQDIAKIEHFTIEMDKLQQEKAKHMKESFKRVVNIYHKGNSSQKQVEETQGGAIEEAQGVKNAEDAQTAEDAQDEVEQKETEVAGVIVNEAEGDIQSNPQNVEQKYGSDKESKGLEENQKRVEREPEQEHPQNDDNNNKN